MKKFITPEIKSILEKRDFSLEPQKSSLDFLRNFARVYHVTKLKNQAFILN